MEFDSRIGDLRTQFGNDIDHTCTLIEYSWCNFFLKLWIEVEPKDRTVKKLESIFNLFFFKYRVKFTCNDIDNVQTKEFQKIAWEVFNFHKNVLMVNIISYLTNILIYDLVLDNKLKK